MPSQVDNCRVFLSYNKANVAVARSVGAHLLLAGVKVWFDEWEIRAGDSIPGRLNEGLQGFDTFLVLWSTHACRSNWVRKELNTAIMQALQDETSQTRIIPCRLDTTPLPPLIQDLRAVDFREQKEGIKALLSELIGEHSRRARLLALQRVLSDLDVRWHDSPGINPIICCPQCGEEDEIRPWDEYAKTHEGHYSGLRCLKCGWSDGGEV
jgi:hypothetical protein